MFAELAKPKGAVRNAQGPSSAPTRRIQKSPILLLFAY
jgi:hypothetical protein